jgi:Carboxypeptidase regulatory-like domain
VSTATLLVLLASLLMGVAPDGSSGGTLTGTVVDSETHAPLAQVRVRVTSSTLQGERVVMTNSLGVYRMETLPSGVYTMACEKDAYASLEQRGVNVVKTGQQSRFDIQLLPEKVQKKQEVLTGQLLVPDAKPAAAQPMYLTSPSSNPGDSARNLRTWGLAVGGGGAALVGGGAVAGGLALSFLKAQGTASDQLTYDRNRNAAKSARDVSNTFYVAGTLALGVGAFLFLSAPGEVKVGAGLEKGKVSLAVRGTF